MSASAAHAVPSRSTASGCRSTSHSNPPSKRQLMCMMWVGPIRVETELLGGAESASETSPAADLGRTSKWTTILNFYINLGADTLSVGRVCSKKLAIAAERYCADNVYG